MSLQLSLALATGSTLALASSAHCAVMCGPLALASRMRRGPSASLSYFAGRLVTYTLAGALAGGAGRVLLLSPWARWAEAVLSWLLAASLLYTAYLLARGASARGGLIKLGTAPRVQRFASLLARVADEPLLLGAATALLPCAALFAALIAAASLGNAHAGAVAMGAFAVISGLAVVGVGQLAALRIKIPMFKGLLVSALLAGAGLMMYRPIPLLRASSGLPSCHLHGGDNASAANAVEP